MGSAISGPWVQVEMRMSRQAMRGSQERGGPCKVHAVKPLLPFPALFFLLLFSFLLFFVDSS
jgi:hypothetical protein